MSAEMKEMLGLLSESATQKVLAEYEATGIRHYACGFLFCGDFVVLIEKKRPKWQAGKLNGVGGRVEIGESMAEAMRREFREEAGIDVPSWRHFATLVHDKNVIGMFTARVQSANIVPNLTDEWVTLRAAKHIDTMNVIPNLRWLVPLALSGNKEVALVVDPGVIEVA